MTLEDAAELYAAFEAAGIDVWIDGGWAVDALLGVQTRAHDDLDIALEAKDVTALRALLAPRGYREVSTPDATPCNFVLADQRGRRVDVHAFVRDAEGRICDGIAYPEGSLTGSGTLGGRVVRCTDPAHLLAFHTGYPTREKDRLDVAALCEKFGFANPLEESQ